MWSDWSGLEKLIWLHVLKGASKIIRTITGAAPLNLEKAVKAAIVKLTQYGKVTTSGGDIYCNNGKLVAVHRSGLPSGYKLLEYVGGGGSQYVITDLYLASTDVVECEYRNSSTTGYGAVYGIFKLGESSALYGNQTYYGYDVANNKVDTDIRVDTEWHSSRHDFVNGTLTIDDTTVTFTPFEFENSTKSAVLSRYYNNSYGYNWKGFVRKFKVTRNGEVVCDLLPAKDRNDVAGLYDLVSGTFYTATGGTLLEGNEVDDYELRIVGTPEVLTIGEDTASGAIASFETTKAAPVRSLSVAIEPIQDLHGYDNPWPAGGGSNKWDEEWEVGSISATTGENILESSVIRSKNYIPILPNTEYFGVVSGASSGYNFRSRFYDADKNYIGTGDYGLWNYNRAYKSPANAAYMRFAMQADYGTTYNHDIAINYPATVTTYAPYSNICPISGWTGANIHVSPTTDAADGETYSITFPTSAGTVYGGTLDVTTGKLTVTKAIVDLGSLTWGYTANWNGAPAFYSNQLSDCATVTDGVVNTISSVFNGVSGDALWYGTSLTSIISLPSSKRLYVRDTRYSTAADFKAAVSGQTVLYPLATPIEVDLTPTEVSTLLGTNNVWSDTGDVTVKFAPNGVVQTASVPNLYAVGNVKDEQDIISGVVTRRTEVSVSGGAITISALAEPVTERVTPQTLRTAAGDNTVSVTSNVDPVYLECKYAASEE